MNYNRFNKSSCFSFFCKGFATALLAALMLSAPLTAAAFGNDETNPPPRVIPAVREWQGATDVYLPSTDMAIICNTASLSQSDSDALMRRLEIVRGYFSELNIHMQTVFGSEKPKKGDITLILDKSEKEALGADGYVMEVTAKYITIKAPEVQGLFYGLVTVVQSLYSDGHVPCGIARDYSYYPIRSGMLDVARAYIPLEYVEEITKYLAFFKLNEIHLHINDNGANNYKIFRLESDVKGLTATDGYYTKDEYRAYQKRMLDYGVTVITEIDTPAHSSCFANVVSHLMLDGNHLDISKPETLEFVKGLFDEYLCGDDPVFVSKKVHIGTDEYPIEYSEQMRSYINALIEHVKARGYTPRFWGSFGNKGFNGNYPVSGDAETNFWAVELSDYNTLFDMGYDVINTCGPVLYVVPGGNYGFSDYYDLKSLYGSWYVNYMGMNASTAVKPDHPQLKGASFALWNDLHTQYGGFSIYDIFDRLKGMICFMAEKTWCGEQTRNIPVEDFLARYEVLSVRGGDSNPGCFVNLPINEDSMAYISAVGFPYAASIDVRLNSYTENASLFTGKVGTFYIGSDGALGFKREGYDFTYDYKLPLDEWVNIKLWANNRQTLLIVDDTYYYFPKNTKNPKLNHSSTFVLPLEKICDGVDGEYRNLYIDKNNIDLESHVANRNLAKNRPVTVSSLEVSDGRFGPQNAVDSNLDTRLSFGRGSDLQWMVVDLGQSHSISKIVVNFFEGIKEYKLYVSDDGESFTEIAHIEKDSEGVKRTDTLDFDGVTARYIKYEQQKRFLVSAWNALYSGVISEFEVYSFTPNSYNELLETTKGISDREVRQARSELRSYMNGEYIFTTHANALRDRLEAAYAAYLSEDSSTEAASEETETSEVNETSNTTSSTPSDSIKSSPGTWIIALLAAASAVIITAVVCINARNKSKSKK